MSLDFCLQSERTRDFYCGKWSSGEKTFFVKIIMSSLKDISFHIKGFIYRNYGENISVD